MKAGHLLLSVLVCFGLGGSFGSALAQGTAFTYQGRLNDGALPAVGLYDFQFTVYGSSNTPGTLVAGPLTNSAVAVSNGLFSVPLDFGAGAFNGAPRWLEIAVRASGSGLFTTLAPRQQLTPAPYALYVPNAGVAADASSVAAAQIGGPLSLAQMPAGTLTNNASSAALSGALSGRFVSPNFQVQNILNGDGASGSVFGPAFTAHGGPLVICVSGSGYALFNPGLIGVNIFLDSADGTTPIDSITITANNTARHLAFVPKQLVLNNVPAGSHVLILQPIDVGQGGNTKIDVNDHFYATLLELPL